MQMRLTGYVDMSLTKVRESRAGVRPRRGRASLVLEAGEPQVV